MFFFWGIESHGQPIPFQIMEENLVKALSFFWLPLLLLSPNTFAQEDYQVAFDLFKKGKYNEAVPYLESAMDTHPDWYFPTMLMGRVQMRLGNEARAIGLFEDALTLEVPSKDIPSVKFLIAKTYMKREEYLKAIKTFDDLTELAPQARKFDVYFNRGVAQMQEGERVVSKSKDRARDFFDMAIQSFDAAVKLPPTKPELLEKAWIQRAMGFYNINELKPDDQHIDWAIQSFEDVLKVKANQEQAHRFIVNLHLQKVSPKTGDARERAFAEMEPKLQRFLKYWPDDAKMAKRLAQSQMGTKQYDKAAKSFRRAIQLDPNDGSLYLELGASLMATNNYKAALAEFEKAKKKGAADRPELYTYVAHSYNKQKNGCYSRDLPLTEKALANLKEGMEALGAQASVLQPNYQRTSANLDTLRTNLKNDNDNHAIALENIDKLKAAIATNAAKLERNRDLHIQQPTAELAAAIEEGTTILTEDRKRLEEELKTVRTYLQAAKKCGDSNVFANTAAMRTVLEDS
jgi:tetratricopeptide (TPR) repeat protein